MHSPSDSTVGDHRVLREPSQHICGGDDVAVGVALPRRQIPVAERKVHGEGRSGVGEVQEALQHEVFPQIMCK